MGTKSSRDQEGKNFNHVFFDTGDACCLNNRAEYIYIYVYIYKTCAYMIDQVFKTRQNTSAN